MGNNEKSSFDSAGSQPHSQQPQPTTEDLDVVIIGAGLSGINSAYRLREAFPSIRYAILERRAEVGGTWSFWKYPGVRSDSSLGVFGLPWHPWPHDMDFAPAGLIADYLRDACEAQGIDKAIRFRHEVTETEWKEDEQRWTLSVNTPDGGERKIRANWMIVCGGYYAYDKARQTTIPGLDDNFKGEVLHPQFWNPSQVNLKNKKVVVIGSGATAITLLPAIAADASQVTMLQRSPSFVMAMPGRDRITRFLRRWLSPSLATRLNFWRRLILETIWVQFLLSFPGVGRKILTMEMTRRLPKGFPVEEHFNPKYDPFRQRLCLCPDGDFFQALHRPNSRVVTAEIETCDSSGIILKNGKGRIDADVIITATGLHMELWNGKDPIMDGKSFKTGERYAWRSCMLDGVPNACSIIGYTQGTWTPGADVHFRTALAVMREQYKRGATSVRPFLGEADRKSLPSKPPTGCNSTYLREAAHRLPKNGGVDPWINGQNYVRDAWNLWWGGVAKGLRFSTGPQLKGKIANGGGY